MKIMSRAQRFIRSFRFACNGLITVAREEQSFRVQLAAALAVFVLALVFRVSKWEAAALILVASSVLVLELINSTLERIVDYMKPRLHHYVEVVKDIMAAAVLVASIGAAAIGLLIFYPYFREFLISSF